MAGRPRTGRSGPALSPQTIADVLGVDATTVEELEAIRLAELEEARADAERLRAELAGVETLGPEWRAIGAKLTEALTRAGACRSRNAWLHAKGVRW